MSYIDKDVLKSFYSENSMMVQQDTLTNIASVVTQIDGIIKSKLGVATPATASTANAYLQNIACRLFVFFAAGKEGITKEEYEYKRRKDFYDTAMNDLNDLKSGDNTLYDNDGNVVVLSSSQEVMFESTKRITGII